MFKALYSVTCACFSHGFIEQGSSGCLSQSLHFVRWHMRWCDLHPILVMECLELYIDIRGKQVCTTRYKKKKISKLCYESRAFWSQVFCLWIKWKAYVVSPSCMSSHNSCWKQHNITFLLPFLKMASYITRPVNTSALSTEMQAADYDLIGTWSLSSLKCCLLMVNWKLPTSLVGLAWVVYSSVIQSVFPYFCSCIRCHQRSLTLKWALILYF